MLDFITERTDSWDFLKNCGKPIFIYGMGDGALKILKVFDLYGITAAGFFASDEFVRGHSFMGHLVHKLSEIEEQINDFVIVLAFAAGYKSLTDRIYKIAEKHTVIAPEVPVFGNGLFTWGYCLEHSEEIEEVYGLLADDLSRRVFSECINFKISGKPELLPGITTERSEIFQNIIRLSDEEVYMDLGAYDGDTVTEFINLSGGKYKKIYAVEPSSKNYKKLKQNVSTINNNKIISLNCAVWKEDTIIQFAEKAGRQASISDTGKEKKARSIDSILEGSECTYIKMDVEGAEREAIKGMENTVKKYAPKLAVSLYHKTPDIFELPLMIHRLDPSYRLYMRHQLYIPAWETNLYAVL